METIAEALSRPEAYPHPTGTIESVETHISWIFLTGSYAYKVKKPLDLGFLDFSTLEKRRHFCQEELRLNRRLCPEIYLAVVPIVKKGNAILVDGEGEIIDYAVKMVRFDRSKELDRMMSKGRLKAEHIDLLAALVARFHRSLAAVPPETGFGHPDNLIKPILHNFTHMEPAITDAAESALLETLKGWTLKEHHRLYPLFLQRQLQGAVRQCHGDMHTGNMVWRNHTILVFDCIEFNDNLSIIDVISDLAFLFMDLEHGGLSPFAWRLLNGYLALTGDYSALPLLRFYALYRAMVRAKVTAIRYSQTGDSLAAAGVLEEHRSYLRLAERYTRKQSALLMLTFGVSGTGKTTHSAEIASAMAAIHIRSDVERKRLAGLEPLERSDKESADSLYTDTVSRQTYRRLLDIAALCLREGISVIVDATFLRSRYRREFMELAANEHALCRILSFQAPRTVLFERVEKRYIGGYDASEADTEVLRSQLEKREPLSPEEERVSIAVDTSKAVDATAIAAALRKLKS